MKRIQSLVLLLSLALGAVAGRGASFEIGESDFLLDGKPLKIHCGEVHYARIPRAYWRHRLQMLKAMGMNAVGCYMFWNYHEREPGKFTWEGRADAAAFCRMAQEEGLWVVLRPGPYACAEWEGGGAPAWLLKDDTISMRSSDPKWTVPAKRWIAEVGRVLAPLQVTRGGPILMVQVENEYGLHGNDAAYIETLRQATVDAGFEVPLYVCNPPRVIRNGFNAKLFQAANFGADPEQRFGIVREVQPKGPLMCAEYYPAWFDTWGAKHNGPKRDRDFFGPIDWMLDHGASFSLYMAHGGTSFGGWTGCRNPFVPNVTSYDFAAPIDEQGRPNPSFFKLRDRLARRLNPGETLGKMPEPIPVKAFGETRMARVASVTAFMTSVTNAFDRPVASEKLDLPFGLVAWTTTVPAGLSGDLAVENIHDFGYASLDGIRLGTFDRRHRGVRLPIAPADVPRALTIVVEAMGRINSSQGMEDRKGLFGRVTLGGTELTKWSASLLSVDPDRIAPDRFSQAARQSGDRAASLPSVYAGVLSVDEPADTFLDLRGFNKGIVFVNGWNLGRYWRIGPQQTLYLPGCWLKKGANAVQVVEMFEPAEPVVRSVATPVLDELHPEDDFNRVAREVTKFPGGAEVASGEFPNTDAAQVVMLKEPVTASQFALQALSSHDRDAKKPFASIAEFDLLDERGEPIANAGLTVAGVDSEEEITMDGVAENAIDGQVESFWYATARALPHWIAFRASRPVKIHGFRYTPCVRNRGRIKSWRFLVEPVAPDGAVTFGSAEEHPFLENHLKLGGTNPDGVRIDVNSLCFTRGGRPWIPIVGELHFSRVPEADWEDALRQMKLGGCSAVATYVFWIHHEEVEGEWNWSGRYDLRKFVGLAKSEGLDVILRIGPWCHGEVRNGGFPDWLLAKNVRLRDETSPEFMALTRTLYSEIARETKGLFWKDGGPIVGVQVENEKTNRPKYLLALKRLAIELGMDAPLFTATGWNRKEGAMIPVDDVVPVFGGYSDAPWAGNTRRQPPSNNFFFTRARNDSGIGSDLAEMKASAKNGWRLPYERYPYATCEIGGGLQSTHRRRYVVDPRDVYVPSLVKLGGGNNMPGYYVYRGGLNPLGRLSTLQESKATKCPNDLPIVDYDYQAPVSSYGEEREHYGMLNLLHLFLQDFQSDFATMKAREATVRPAGRDDVTTLRAAARSRDGSGFVFFSTYQRLAKLAAQTNVVFAIDGVTFPSVDIPEGIAGIFPYNLKVGDATLVAATAQLFCRDGDDFLFVELPGVKPQFVWKDGRAGRTRLLAWEDAIRMRRDGGRLVKREFRRGKTVAAKLKRLDAAPFAIARPEVAAELQLDGPHEVAWYEISAEEDGFVEIAGVCDVEQLHVDGELVADFFYNGRPWRIPTKLFKGRKAHLAVAAFKDNVYREW